MKAKELAEILLRNPDYTVLIKHDHEYTVYEPSENDLTTVENGQEVINGSDKDSINKEFEILNLGTEYEGVFRQYTGADSTEHYPANGGDPIIWINPNRNKTYAKENIIIIQ